MEKKYYLIIAVLLLLIITNPNMQDFRDFIGTVSVRNGIDDLSKRSNYFIFSRYDDSTERYIGILGNFYSIGYYAEIPKATPAATKVDSNVVK